MTKEERTQYNREYYKNHKDKILQWHKKYRKKNKDKLSQNKKEYYKKNRDKIKEHSLQYYRENREQLSEKRKSYSKKYCKNYYKKHKNKINKATKEYYRKKINKGIAVWENLYGKLPKGCKIIHLDGDKNNNDINNLVMITNQEMITMNKKGLKFNINKDLTETNILIAKLSIKRIEKEKR